MNEIIGPWVIYSYLWHDNLIKSLSVLSFQWYDILPFLIPNLRIKLTKGLKPSNNNEKANSDAFYEYFLTIKKQRDFVAQYMYLGTIPVNYVSKRSYFQLKINLKKRERNVSIMKCNLIKISSWKVSTENGKWKPLDCTWPPF